MFFKSLSLTGSIQGFFLILLLRSKGKNSLSDKLLMVWLGIIGFQLLFYYDNLSASPLASDYLQLLGFSLPLLGSPALYLYIYSLSFGQEFEWKKKVVHILPYVVFNVVTFGLYLFYPGSIVIRDGYPHFIIQLSTIGFVLTNVLAVVSGYYTFQSLFILLKYQKMLPDNYSYTERITLNWLKWMVLSLLVMFVALFLLIKYSTHYGLLTRQNLFAVVGSILSFYVFFVGYFGLRQTAAFRVAVVSGGITDETLKTSYKKSSLTDEKAGLLFQKLKIHMQEQQPYLENELSLVTLARQLELTPNQLSQVINQKAATNFFNFINAYRVEAVKQKLKDPAYAQYAIVAIGYDCGFRSKSSFNKIFKQLVGKTPSEYQKG